MVLIHQILNTSPDKSPTVTELSFLYFLRKQIEILSGSFIISYFIYMYYWKYLATHLEGYKSSLIKQIEVSLIHENYSLVRLKFQVNE